ncbi:MAG: hypothetical protein ICV78_11145 [Tolypothrix sp. Co-bin9]|nr:hypothetical protein [Tolypothrix sp. Co-bin9]
MKNLPLFTELTLSEQEKISGGATDNFVIGSGGVISECGDKARTPDGTVIIDQNCKNDPFSKKNDPFSW